VPPEQRPWELYDLTRDFSQARDVAEQNPQKLEELKQLFDAEARRSLVYPLSPGFEPPPSATADRTHFVYHAGTRRIPPAAAPRLAGRAHRITADVVLPTSGAEGVIVAQGGRHGGVTLYVQDGRVTYETSAYGHSGGSLVSPERLSPGRTMVIVDVTPVGGTQGGPLGGRRSIPMMARLLVNGSVVGESQVLMAGSGDTLDVGSDLVSPVSPTYTSPFAFTGQIVAVTIDLP
jgi:arylsulfatase